MNEVQIFNFKENSVRTQYASDEVWFCLKDVCKILDISNSRKVVERLNQKGVTTSDTLTNGGMQMSVDDLDRGLTPEELRILKELFDDLDEE